MEIPNENLWLEIRVVMAKRNGGQFLSFEERFEMGEENFASIAAILAQFNALAEKIKTERREKCQDSSASLRR